MPDGIASPSSATNADPMPRSLPMMGHRPGKDLGTTVVANDTLTTTLTGAAAQRFGPFSEGGVYEFTVIRTAGTATAPECLHYAPGDSGVVAAATHYLVWTSLVPVFQHKMLPGQTHVSFIVTGASANQHSIMARRLH